MGSDDSFLNEFGPFDQEDVKIIMSFSAQVASAITNSQALGDAEVNMGAAQQVKFYVY